MKRSSAVFSLIMAAAPVALRAQAPIGDLSASDASVRGAVVMDAGSTGVGSGSNVTAGQAAASLRLRRGGEVRICPRSSVSISASANGRDLMLAMGTGAIETHYVLTNSADQILTPDFRILLAGPGEFHFAVASDSRGNACVRSLPSNAASLIVNELLGDGVYQVRPGEQILFRSGSVKDPSTTVPPDCGCPVIPPSLRAEPQSVPRPAEPALPPTPSSLTAPPPPTPASEVHISVDAPFVYRAKPLTAPPAPVVSRVRLQDLPPLMFTVAEAQAPAPPPVSAAVAPKPAKTENKGFIGHLKSFFSSIFGRH